MLTNIYKYAALAAVPAIFSANFYNGQKWQVECPTYYDHLLDSYEQVSPLSDIFISAVKGIVVGVSWPLVLTGIAATGFHPKLVRGIICPGYAFSPSAREFYDAHVYASKKGE